MHLEVAMALDSSARVVPVLLPGGQLPAEADLPVPLKPLARRNALTLSDEHWDADIGRLADAAGLPRRHRAWPWALVGAAVTASVVGLLCWLKPWVPADPTARLLGRWQAEVRYAWGATHVERFEFKRHAGQPTGTATFLRYPRAIEKLEFDGTNMRFETRSQQSMGNETRELTHRYSAELRGLTPDERLALRMETSGGFQSTPPLKLEARRVVGVADEAGVAGASGVASAAR